LNHAKDLNEVPMKSVVGNPHRFVIFTVFYSARAYYPILAVLFIDLGLTLDQFVLLNLVWAATIFLFEVPSGALADIVGRKKLLVTASTLMMLEMLCLLLAPRGGGSILMAICVLNRILSGLSEACASGADEALAYDSLPESNRKESWDRLLSTAMRWRSTGYVITMILGAFLYDPSSVNRLLPDSAHLSVDVAHRLPVAMVLIQSFICLAATLSMYEPTRERSGSNGNSIKSSFQLTGSAIRWIISHRQIGAWIIIGLTIDSIIRNFATINSSYFRIIHLPDWTFGLIGAMIGGIGWFVPTLAKKLNHRFSTLTNLAIATGFALIGLTALIPAWRLYGLIPALFLMTTLNYLGFTLSRALHAATDSSKRATVLSVKGLAFNLGYGLFSLAFSRLLLSFGDQPAASALRSALTWQVPPFAIVIATLLYLAHRRARCDRDEKHFSETHMHD